MSKNSNQDLCKEWERRITIYRSSDQTQANWCKANDTTGTIKFPFGNFILNYSYHEINA